MFSQPLSGETLAFASANIVIYLHIRTTLGKKNSVFFKKRLF